MVGPSLAEATRVWVRVAAMSFGGPAGQVAVMHKLVVEEKGWVDEERFLHALNYCMLLPGPEAQQLATYLGWLLHGTRGGLIAGGLFVLPGFVSILALSILYTTTRELPVVDGLFFGLKAAVLAVVVEALLRVSKKALVDGWRRTLAVASFVALFFFDVPFPVVVLGAAVFGSLKGGVAQKMPDVPLPPWRDTVVTVLGWLAVWWVPLLAMMVALGPDHVLSQIGLFFSGTAMVTFGGAYAVLAYVAQQAVDVHHWLLPGEMLDGLGMAETTPGPLVQVVQFVGYMGAWRHPGALHPVLAGVFGSVVTTWVTFAPCFLWIFAGAPYVEWLRANPRLSAALSAVTAAVAGVIANLALWFALHVLFREVATVSGPFGSQATVPTLGSLDGGALAIAVLSAFLLLGTRLGMLGTLGVAALLGMLQRLL
jgi:chromate transporter